LSTFACKSRNGPLRLCLVQTLLLVVCAAPSLLAAQPGGGTQACGGNSTVDASGAASKSLCPQDGACDSKWAILITATV
jgi:hypothetical protein